MSGRLVKRSDGARARFDALSRRIEARKKKKISPGHLFAKLAAVENANTDDKSESDASDGDSFVVDDDEKDVSKIRTVYRRAQGKRARHDDDDDDVLSNSEEAAKDRARFVVAIHSHGSLGIKKHLRDFLSGADTHSFIVNFESRLLPPAWCSFGRDKNTRLAMWLCRDPHVAFEESRHAVEDNCPICRLPRTLSVTMKRHHGSDVLIGAECAQKMGYIKSVFDLAHTIAAAADLTGEGERTVPAQTVNKFMKSIKALDAERVEMQLALRRRYSGH